MCSRLRRDEVSRACRLSRSGRFSDLASAARYLMMAAVLAVEWAMLATIHCLHFYIVGFRPFSRRAWGAKANGERLHCSNLDVCGRASRYRRVKKPQEVVDLRARLGSRIRTKQEGRK